MATREYRIARINCGCCESSCRHSKIIITAERDDNGDYQIRGRQAKHPDGADGCWDIDTPHDTKRLAEIREIVAAWYSTDDWDLEWWVNGRWDSVPV
jgi:hypothetical protein